MPGPKTNTIMVFNNCLSNVYGMSGSDRRAIEYSKEFLSLGYHLKIVSPYLGKTRYAIFKDRIEFINSSNLDVTKTGFFLGHIIRVFQACKKIKQFKKERLILYSTSDLLADIIPALYLKLKNKENILVSGLHLIAPNPFKGFRNAWRDKVGFPSVANIYYFITQNIIVFLLRKNADLVLVSNEMDKNLLVKRRFSPSRVAVALGGIDKDAIMSSPPSQNRYDACFVGRDHPQKGIDDLIRIWEEVVEFKKDARLAILGYFDSLQRKMAGSPIGKNIEFMGFKDGAEKFSIMKSSKMLLFPSYYESFGMVVAEAFGCGLPVIAYDLPVYKGIFGEGLIKVDLGDKQAFAEKVVNLLTREDERKGISRSALEEANKFNWHNSVLKILETLEEL